MRDLELVEQVEKDAHDLELALLQAQTDNDALRLEWLGRERAEIEKPLRICRQWRKGGEKSSQLIEQLRHAIQQSTLFGNILMIEISPGVGGQEARLWAKDVQDMLLGYAQRYRLQAEKLGVHHGSRYVAVKGKEAWARFKWEDGPHLVQRMPITDNLNRIHSSVAVVRVMVEPTNHQLRVAADQLRERFGRDAVPDRPNAIRLTHLPTMTEVLVDDEDSKLHNHQKALRILRAKLYQQQLEHQGIIESNRPSRIRTYNFIEHRVKDHRSGLQLYNLEKVLAGQLEPFTQALAEREAQQQLDHATAS